MFGVEQHQRSAPNAEINALLYQNSHFGNIHAVFGPERVTCSAPNEEIITMSIDEQRAYLEQTLRKAPEGSARRIWAAAQLAQLQPRPAAASCHSERRSAKNLSTHQEQNS